MLRSINIELAENGFVLTEWRKSFAESRVWVAESVTGLLGVIEILCEREDDGRETTTD